jgi:hypothetical protein
VEYLLTGGFVIQRFQENLVHEAEQNDDERDQYFGLSLRELVHTYKWQTLVLFKCLLLQPKVNRHDVCRLPIAY